MGSTRGMGLGLSLCKQLVEAMGGRVWVESPGSIGVGSRFCLTLPVSPPSGKEASKAKVLSLAASREEVL